ncbi:MAG TPA: NAD(+) diphosphatase [Beutenbergiaceae bacterium]|nr:NAD(+) diphosphatase [Beutenbergiaceae bacterium]
MRSDDLPLSRSTVDRDGHRRVDENLLATLLQRHTTRILHLIGGDVLTAGDSLVLTAPAGPPDGTTAASTEHVPAAYRPVPTTPVTPEDLVIYLGRDEDYAYIAQIHPESTGVADWADEVSRQIDDPQGTPANRRSHLRDVGWHLSPRDAGLATQAVAIANWHSTHRHCPRCGAATEVIEAGWVRRCPVDGSHHFPRTDPAVIMAITDDDDRLLLARAATWPQRRYSVPAGFVEPGESLENAVRREVEEETAVQVGEVTYQASQPWPFPASLMVGCTGVARTTEVEPDGVEVTAAMFLTREELTRAVTSGDMVLPRATSIAHHLIAKWYGGPLPEPPEFDR